MKFITPQYLTSIQGFNFQNENPRFAATARLHFRTLHCVHAVNSFITIHSRFYV